MAKPSKLFPRLAGVLVLIIIALSVAIVHQRQAGEKARLKARLEQDERRMEVLSGKAETITEHVANLRLHNQGLEERWVAAQPLLYSRENRPQIESFLGDAAVAANLTLTTVEEVSVDETETYLEHVLNIRMEGPMRNIPAWADRFFRQPRLVLVDRIAIVSPDYLFRKVRIKATIRYFQPRDPEQIIPNSFPVERFEVPLDYLTAETDASDPVYGQAMASAQAQSKSLSDMHDELEEAARLEKRYAALTKLLIRLRSLQEEVRDCQNAVLENLPTLYLRVRNSPLGSVAMVISGESPRFPEITVDD